MTGVAHGLDWPGDPRPLDAAVDVRTPGHPLAADRGATGGPPRAAADIVNERR